MIVIVKYIDFHWDNYQGGSGKTVELQMKATLPDDIKVSEIKNFINEKLELKLTRDRCFNQGNQCSVKSIELFD